MHLVIVQVREFSFMNRSDKVGIRNRDHSDVDFNCLRLSHRLEFFSCKTRSNLACPDIDMLPISSRALPPRYQPT